MFLLLLLYRVFSFPRARYVDLVFFSFVTFSKNFFLIAVIFFVLLPALCTYIFIFLSLVHLLNIFHLSSSLLYLALATKSGGYWPHLFFISFFNSHLKIFVFQSIVLLPSLRVYT